MPVITKSNEYGPHRTGSLSPNLKPEEITKRLGFGPGTSSDDGKIDYEWCFEVDGVHCAIWDYKGGRWSTYGPTEALAKVFPEFIKG